MPTGPAQGPNMAKPASIKIRLNSSADTGFFYVTKKNARTKTDKLVMKKYDPVVRKHVEFREGKIKKPTQVSDRRHETPGSGRAFCVGLDDGHARRDAVGLNNPRLAGVRGVPPCGELLDGSGRPKAHRRAFPSQEPP